MNTPSDVYQRIAADLDAQGWTVVEDFLEPDAQARLRGECLEHWEQGDFRPAGVGRGASFQIRPEVRSDRVLWLDSGKLSAAQQAYFDHLERLRGALNQRLYLGLFDFEGHFAVYPPGTRYRKHLDQFKGIGLRTVTAILYLNPDWQEGDGGMLRLYTHGEDSERYVDIAPRGGTLVSFLSAEYLHEVLPSQRERLSLTGWFRCRG